jgi:predicted NAD/FAD-binding protein
VIEGGSSGYIEPLARSFRDHVRLNCPVHNVQRTDDGVVIHSPAGSETFDRVVFACHSDQALALLADPSLAEQQILGALPYADNDVVLHTDTRLLPDRKLAWASWNYRLSGSQQQQAAVTYDMNILQGIDSATTFCVSLNQTPMINPLKILARYTYAHPQYSLAAVAAQARWEELHGARNTFYCGAYWANGFHEDGVVSALRVAQAFGESL